MQLCALFRLAFASAPDLQSLTSLHNVTRRSRLQKVLCAIGHQHVFRLGGWSPRLPTGFLVSCGTLDPGRSFRISRTGFLPSLIPLPNGFCYPTRCLRQSTTPIDRSPSVWPLPLSLAATQGISVDFSSSGYLDVSVPRVPPA